MRQTLLRQVSLNKIAERIKVMRLEGQVPFSFHDRD
jgi:hypothetical protein